MRNYVGFLLVSAAMGLSPLVSFTWAQTSAIDPPKGRYLPVDPVPAPLPGELGTAPIFRPAKPPVVFGNLNDSNTTRRISKSPDRGESAFKPSGSNFGQTSRDSSEQVIQAVSPFQDFAGSGINGWTPGDPDVAAGGGYVCQVVNDDYIVYDKCGNVVFTRDTNDLFGLDPAYKIFDPHIIYDPWNGRWVMTWHVTNSSVASYGKIFMAITESSDPVGVGSWYYYPFEMVQDAGTSNESFPDYYDVGYSSDLVYIAGDQFTSSSFRWSRMVIFRKSEIYNAATAFRRDHYNFNNPDGTAMRLPRAIKQQSAFSNTAMFLNSRRTGGNKLTKWTISDPFGANTRTGTDISVSDYSTPPDAIQPNGVTLDTIDCRLMGVVQARDSRNNTGVMISTGLATSYLWAGDTANRSACRLYHINEGTNAVILDRIFGAPSYYYWFPSVACDYQDTAMWVFARCGVDANQYPEVRYVGFEGGTFVNSSTSLHAGTGNYGGFRWGDYFGASLDWDDYYSNSTAQCRIWMNGMYGISGSWATHIGSVSTFAQGALNVAPASGFTTEGPRGGPFTVTSQNFTLTNSGETGLRYTVSDNASWLSASVASGELYDTPDTAVVTISLSSAANLLAPGVYNATITFQDCANSGATATRSVQLTVRPQNDDCADAIVHSGGTVSGNTTLATGTDRSSCAGTADTGDVWYTWTAPCSGMAVADTCGSGFDTSLSVFTSCLLGATELACNDDFILAGCDPFARASRVTWSVIAGRTYRVRVAGYNGASGDFNLYIGTAADFNRDGVVDLFDYLDFVNAFSTNQPVADFNGDGVIDFFDYLDFLQVFSTGC